MLGGTHPGRPPGLRALALPRGAQLPLFRAGAGRAVDGAPDGLGPPLPMLVWRSASCLAIPPPLNLGAGLVVSERGARRAARFCKYVRSRCVDGQVPRALNATFAGRSAAPRICRIGSVLPRTCPAYEQKSAIPGRLYSCLRGLPSILHAASIITESSASTTSETHDNF